ncbi:hypothetical protein SNE40_005510 [Patella caerulea]|uniref:NAD(P)H oxidoreductase RTN4IP1, mitochondrial n=1 Tax=Patella caerulea TaxID=87958 RepID=A0AAN8K1J4_PATCE
MLAWQIHSYGGNDQLTLSATNRIPMIKNPNDILVEVHAASVNPIDIRMRDGYGQKILNVMRNQGLINTRSEFPLTMGRDFSGIVVESGRNVKKFKPGDEVYGVLGAQRQGSHAEYTISSEREMAHKPNHLSHVEAASIPYVALTNWSAINTAGRLTANNTTGKRILVIAGSGGIGTFAIQLLKAWGGEIVTTCSGDASEQLLQLGADYTIDYKQQDVLTELNKLPRFDFILDPLGGDKGEQYSQFLKSWQNAKYVSIAPPFLKNFDNYGILPGLVKNIGDLGCSALKGAKDGKIIRWAVFAPSKQGLKTTTDLLNSRQIHPVVEKVFEFEDLPSAYEKIESGHSRGKTVIKMK